MALPENVILKIYGRQPVLEALLSDSKVRKVWLAKGASGKIIGRIEKLCMKKDIHLEKTNKNNLQKIVGAVVHQNVAAEVEFNPFVNDDVFSNRINEKDILILILDQIQDAHNLGAILRTAEITATDVVILPEKGSAALTSTVAKTSAGALFHVPLYSTDDLAGVIELLKTKNVSIYAAMGNAENNIYEMDFSDSTAIVIGSEGKGVRKNIANLCDGRISIPQYGSINSLNASVSTAVILYEIVRQREFERTIGI